MADVAVVTMSEFGRTVAENGNAGSDHGHGTTMLVMGWAARGGPGSRTGTSAVTSSFRNLFGEIPADRQGAADHGAVFPGHSQPPRSACSAEAEPFPFPGGSRIFWP
jgi:hypothetical protein